MNDLTLLVMAAGMGSRYGGLKQLDAFGPNGETLIDYSVYDAIQAGFTKVVFIIRRDFETDFKSQITNKYNGKITVKFSFQELNDLPNGFNCPAERKNPWGTGHAILTAENLINEPFVVINGDDFYSRESFKVIHDFYNKNSNTFSMVAYRLDNTLSKFGGVTRGICELFNDQLCTVVETANIKKTDDMVSSNRDIKLDGTEPVSVNLWGFTPILFNYLNEMFVDFIQKKGKELKSEFLIPTIVNDLIQLNREKVKVLHSNANWFGVTYKEDKPFVISEIAKLITAGIYPEQLF